MTMTPAAAPRVRHDVCDVVDLLAPNALQVIIGVDAAGQPLPPSLPEAAPLHVPGPRGAVTDALAFALLARCYALHDPEALRGTPLDPRHPLSPLFPPHAPTRP